MRVVSVEVMNSLLLGYTKTDTSVTNKVKERFCAPVAVSIVHSI